jgi:hypothetical protein
MKQYDQYTSHQLFGELQEQTGSVFNYLLRLLLKKEDSKKYIEQMLASGNINLRNGVIRLLSTTDIDRHADSIAKLLDSAGSGTKKIIISRLTNNKNSRLTNALLKRVLDEKEENFIKRAAITVLGNSEDKAIVKTLSNVFNKFDADGKIELLIALNKLNDVAVIPLMQEALSDSSETVRFWAEKLQSQRRENKEEKHVPEKKGIEDSLSVYKYWIRDPASYPDSCRLYFSEGQRAVYEEIKAGEPELTISFYFKIEDTEMVFIGKNAKESRSGYSIRKDKFRHPYLGNQPCYVLTFHNRDVVINNIAITATEYYHFFEKE